MIHSHLKLSGTYLVLSGLFTQPCDLAVEVRKSFSRLPMLATIFAKLYGWQKFTDLAHWVFHQHGRERNGPPYDLGSWWMCYCQLNPLWPPRSGARAEQRIERTSRASSIT